MPRFTRSSAKKAATRKSVRPKSIQKLPAGSKPTRQRRSFAGCIGCRARGKKCDQEQLTGGDGFPTCRWCLEHGVPCTGGFNVKKLSGLTNRWRELFCIRVKLYMGETGQARGIPGWKRSDPLRLTLLSREEVYGYISSHYDMPEEEEEAHYDCIYSPNGICRFHPPVQPLDVTVAQSPSTYTEASSDFGSPVLSQDNMPWSPRIENGEFDEATQLLPITVGEFANQLDLPLFPLDANAFDLGSLAIAAEEIQCESLNDMHQDHGAFHEYIQGVPGHQSV